MVIRRPRRSAADRLPPRSSGATALAVLAAAALGCTSIDGPTSSVDTWKQGWKSRASAVADGAASGAEAVGDSIGTAYQGVRDGFEDPDPGAYGRYPKRYARAPSSAISSTSRASHGRALRERGPSPGRLRARLARPIAAVTETGRRVIMPAMTDPKPTHCIAVIGGAVAGAEVAGVLADRGAEVVVFEQNARPYGKIEDGLPRWHVALRQKEYEAIGANLSRPRIHLVPLTKVGRDVGFRELVEDWGFSAVVLACGAWRDRPLPVEGADAYVGRGLIYQNPFIIWFNHADEPDYDGPVFEPRDGALVVGGGLASIDVVKALMLETTRAKLLERGIEVDLVELEVKGIPKTLAAHGLSWEDLGLEGCTLFYRRGAADMPLVEMPEGADERRREKVRAGREKVLAKAMEKYRFHFEPQCMPDGLIVEDGRLVGLRFRRTKIEDGRVVPQDETFERRGCYVISSIGSIPEEIPGVPMKGELIAFADWDLGRLADFPNVFSAGNVVTGKGNIVASRKHARRITEELGEKYLALHPDRAGEAELVEAATEEVREGAADLADEITSRPPISEAQLAEIRRRVAERQREVGYPGDYESWIAKFGPRG